MGLSQLIFRFVQCFLMTGNRKVEGESITLYYDTAIRKA